MNTAQVHARSSVAHVTWWEFVQRAARGESHAEIGRKVGVAKQTIGRWQHLEPRPENVVQFARVYGVDVIEAFIAAGIFTADEARRTIDQPDPRALSNEDLIREIAARMGVDEQEVLVAADGRTARGGRGTDSAARSDGRGGQGRKSQQGKEVAEDANIPADHPVASPGTTAGVDREKRRKGRGSRDGRRQGKRGDTAGDS